MVYWEVQGQIQRTRLGIPSLGLSGPWGERKVNTSLQSSVTNAEMQVGAGRHAAREQQAGQEWLTFI